MGVLGEDTQKALSHLVHFVATPALLIDLLSRTDVSQVLGIGFAIAALSVLVAAALPTAQNVFVDASRFGRSELVARDSIAVTTVACIPLFFGFAALLA